MKSFRSIIISVLCIGVVFLAVYALLINLRGTDKPRIKITEYSDGTGDINIYIERSLIRKELSSLALDDIMSLAKVRSAEGDSLEITDFDEGSILSRYGFKEGDMITAINGESVKDVPELIKVCDGLNKDVFGDMDEKEVKVSLVRDDKDMNMNFKIPEFIPEKVYYTMRLEKQVGK